MDKVIEDKGKRSSREELEKTAGTLFWNINFFVVCGTINKIVHSLGSDMLMKTVEEVCDEVNTPVASLVKHGVLMWYKKNLQIDSVKRIVAKDDCSEIAKRTMKSMIINHCSMHKVNYRDRQKIGAFFKKEFSTKKSLGYRKNQY